MTEGLIGMVSSALHAVHLIDFVGKLEIQFRESALIVRGKGDADLVPPVEKYVGVMIQRFRHDGDGIDDTYCRRPVSGVQLTNDTLGRHVAAFQSPRRMKVQVLLDVIGRE